MKISFDILPLFLVSSHLRNPRVAILDQAGGGGHRVHRRTGVHVRPVQSLHSSMAEVKGLQPGHICPEPARNL